LTVLVAKHCGVKKALDVASMHLLLLVVTFTQTFLLYKGFNDEDAGVKATMSYQLQGGGRMFPPVSREVYFFLYERNVIILLCIGQCSSLASP